MVAELSTTLLLQYLLQTCKGIPTDPIRPFVREDAEDLGPLPANYSAEVAMIIFAPSNPIFSEQKDHLLWPRAMIVFGAAMSNATKSANTGKSLLAKWAAEKKKDPAFALAQTLETLWKEFLRHCWLWC
jgi:hypothetical protein